MSNSVRERVARGIKLLNRHKRGWWKRIDVDRLRMAEPCNCIPGQLYEAYGLAPSNMKGFQYGFNEVVLYVPSDVAAGRYGALTREWRRVIRQRRSEESV